jgi:hypothetical protein
MWKGLMCYDVAQLLKPKPFTVSIRNSCVLLPDACVFEAAVFLCEINFREFSYRLMIRYILVCDAKIENRRVVK